jgi:hypothetical protein
MNPFSIRHFTSALDVTFPRPIAWTPGLLEESVSKLAEAIGFPLRSDQVKVRNTDILYNYELTASFFNGNASFTRNADKMSLTLNNAQGEEEQKLILEINERFGSLFLLNAKILVQFTLGAHIDVGTQQKRHQFLKRFSPSERVELSGAVGYVTSKNLEEEIDPIRIMIEPSLSFPEALYVSWQVKLPSLRDWKGTINLILESFEEVAELYDLKVTFPILS